MPWSRSIPIAYRMVIHDDRNVNPYEFDPELHEGFANIEIKMYTCIPTRNPLSCWVTMYVYTYIYMYMIMIDYIYIYIYVYVYGYIYIYIPIHTCIRTS